MLLDVVCRDHRFAMSRPKERTLANPSDPRPPVAKRCVKYKVMFFIILVFIGLAGAMCHF